MKNLLGILLIAALASAPAFTDGARSKDYSIPKDDSSRYVGLGFGWFESSKAFEAVTGSYVKAKPQGDGPILVNAMIGYKFSPYFRGDINGQHRALKYEHGGDLRLSQKFKNYSVFANAYIDTPNSTTFVPYVTAGAGYAYNSVGDLEKNNIVTSVASGIDTHNFAWNAGGGLKMRINKNLDLDLSYRYADLGRIKIKGSTLHTYNAGVSSSSSLPGASQKLNLHQTMLSLVYNY